MNLYFLVRNVHNVYIIIIVYMRVHCKLASKLEIKFFIIIINIIISSSNIIIIICFAGITVTHMISVVNHVLIVQKRMILVSDVLLLHYVPTTGGKVTVSKQFLDYSQSHPPPPPTNTSRVNIRH